MNTPSEDTVKYTFLYLAVYTIMSFALLAVFLRTKPTPIYLTDFNAFHKFNPFLGMVLVFTMFAMAGIPPLVGFWGKYYLLLAAFQVNYIALLKIALIVSLISTFYYIRVVKIILFENLRLPKVFTAQPSMILIVALLLAMVGFVTVIDSFIISSDFVALSSAGIVITGSGSKKPPTKDNRPLAERLLSAQTALSGLRSEEKLK